MGFVKQIDGAVVTDRDFLFFFILKKTSLDGNAVINYYTAHHKLVRRVIIWGGVACYRRINQ